MGVLWEKVLATSLVFCYTICIIEQKAGCDFPIIRCPLVHKGELCPMNTMEVLTLLPVIFTALSYIDDHNNKKK